MTSLTQGLNARGTAVSQGLNPKRPPRGVAASSYEGETTTGEYEGGTTSDEYEGKVTTEYEGKIE